MKQIQSFLELIRCNEKGICKIECGINQCGKKGYAHSLFEDIFVVCIRIVVGKFLEEEMEEIQAGGQFCGP